MIYVKIIAMSITWLLTSSSMVFFMIVGLAFFYGGLVRKKNILNTLMMSFISIGIVIFTWALLGYSLAYADGSDWLGGLSYALFNNFAFNENLTEPKILDFLFQATFAIITAALVSGAVVDKDEF